jgi:two-component system, LuxR family, response regulator FixJ
MNNPDPNKHQIIYVVEPDGLMRERIASIYISSPCSVMIYTSAEDFLDQSEITAGCLILGIEMPGMSAVELMQELKYLGIKIPVIVLGDRDDLPKAVKVMRAGALDFIGKPFTDQRLKISVEKMLPLTS